MMGSLCLHIIFLIRSSLCMNRLTFGCNKFRKMPYVSQLLSAPTGTIFMGENNEMTNTMTSHRYLHKELAKEQVGEEFTEKWIPEFIPSKSQTTHRKTGTE